MRTSHRRYCAGQRESLGAAAQHSANHPGPRDTSKALVCKPTHRTSTLHIRLELGPNGILELPGLASALGCASHAVQALVGN
eukprot:830595-Pyramimonas_sp.AAC.1